MTNMERSRSAQVPKFENRRLGQGARERCFQLRILGLTIFLGIVPAIVWYSGCASSSPPSSVAIAGGGSIRLATSGEGFKPAENDRVGISAASLQAVNFDGNYYVRWTFTIRPKQALELAAIRIEDVTGAAPVLLVNDVAPQQEGGLWRENAGLMEISSASAGWLLDPKETVRVFRFTISEPNGQSYVLYQGVRESPAAKEAIRRTVGR
jgi:hypothetical protein